MEKALLVLLCLLASTLGAAQELKKAAEDSREGSRARARLTNEAATRVDELIAALRDADDEVRLSAAWALRHSANRKAVKPLAAALRDENFSVARAAAESLRQFGAVQQPLRELMRDSDPAIRWRGVINVDHLALAELSDEVAELAMNDPVDFIRADAAWTLRRAAGPKVAEALVKCLADPSSRTRDRAGIGLRGKIADELLTKGSPARQKAIETLLWVVETQGERPYALQAATEKLIELLTRPLGTDAAKWRAFVEKVEAAR